MMPAAVFVCAQPAPAPNAAADDAARRELQQQAAKLVDPASKPEEREQAAERIVRRRSPDAKELLLQDLQNPANRPAQLAVAKALALEAIPDDDYIAPLIALLGRDSGMTEAAAQALANYNRNPNVFGELLRFVQNTNQAERSRMVVIRALGAFVDKQVAATLVPFLGDPHETSGIRNAVADALVEMTGLQQYGQDVGQWQRWWATEGNLSDAAFRETQLNRRIARYALVKREYKRLADHIESVLNKVNDRTPPEQRTELVLSWLKDSEPSIREVAARLVQQQKANGQRIAPEVIETLRGMVGDSAAEVRLEVAKALKQINDAGAVDALLAQLAVETDTEVKAEIAHTLARAENPKAAEAMLRQLSDPSTRAAEAAAECLRDLADKLRNDGALALSEKVRIALLSRLNNIANDPGADTLRGAVADAMAALHDESLELTFYRLTIANNRDNTVHVRVAAARGLGTMETASAREGAAQALVRVLNNDPDQSVRLAAVTALASAGTFDQADAVYGHIAARLEPDSSVREMAWEVLKKLLVHPDATSNQLSVWPNRFQAEPDKRLVALKAWRDKLIIDANDRSLRERALKDLAGVQENIGATLMTLKRPDEAAFSFRAALDYWLAINANRATTAQLIDQLIKAQLKAKKYSEAAVFAKDRINANEQDQETMGQAIRNELDDLMKANDFKSAKELSDQAAKIGLKGIYADAIHRQAQEIEKKLSP